MKDKNALGKLWEAKLIAYKGNQVLVQLYSSELKNMEEEMISSSSLIQVEKRKNGVKQSPQEKWLQKKENIELKFRKYNEEVEEVNAFLKSLNEEDRKIIDMKYNKNYTFQEIANRLNYSRQAVTKRIKNIFIKEANRMMNK